MPEAVVRLVLEDAAEASRLAAALEPDNDGSLEAAATGNVLELRASSGSAMGLLRSLDDAMACLRAAGVP